MISRRLFLLGMALPLDAIAADGLPVIGFFHEGAANGAAAASFREGLSEAGYADGRNVRILYRWAEGHYDRLPRLVDELIRGGARIIAGGGGPRSAQAAKSATSTIPIVFTVGVDPVEARLVANLNRPGGNVTGVTMFTTALTSKRLELLRELLPRLSSVGFLANPDNPNAAPQVRDLEATCSRFGVGLRVVHARRDDELDGAFGKLLEARVDALIVSADPFLSSRRARLVGLASKHAIPTVYQWRDFPAAGGLMSYGASNADAYRKTGIYVGKILSGAHPGELPVLQAEKFELVLNLATAKALGLSIPASLRIRADEVIE